MGLLIRDALHLATATRNPPLKVIMTRETDVNLGLSQRAYCAWLSAQTCQVYRLPSEAEWEAAARGNEVRPYA